jgi:hypothetical protein
MTWFKAFSLFAFSTLRITSLPLGGSIIGFKDGSAFYGLSVRSFSTGRDGGSVHSNAGRRRLLEQSSGAREVTSGGSGGGDGGTRERGSWGRSGGGHWEERKAVETGTSPRLSNLGNQDVDARGRGKTSGGSAGGVRELDSEAREGRTSQPPEQVESRDVEGGDNSPGGAFLGGRGRGETSPSRRRFQGSRSG